MGVGPLGFDHLSALSAGSLWYLQSATRRLDYYCGSGLDGLTGAGVGQVDGKARMVWGVDLTEEEVMVLNGGTQWSILSNITQIKEKRSK